MNIILFDDRTRRDLLPLTFTRPVAGIRIGIMTIAEKWQRIGKVKVSFDTVDYLRAKFPAVVSSAEDNYFINGKVAPDKKLVTAIKKLKPGQALKHQNYLLAFNAGKHYADREKVMLNADEY